MTPRSECLAFGVFWIPLRKSVIVCIAAAVTRRIPLWSSMVLHQSCLHHLCPSTAFGGLE